MMNRRHTFTSESVSEGHPDKLCDRISDEVVDLFFREGPTNGVPAQDIRVACETLATTNRVVVAGETRGPMSIGKDAVIEVARQAIKDIGYEQNGFHWKTAQIEVLLHAQSADIKRGVDEKKASDGTEKEQGAGDQGMMFGYACSETPTFMPAPIYYAHKMLFDLARARKSGAAPALGPDAKSQLTMSYENGQPVGIAKIVVSTQHLIENMSSDDVRAIVEPHVRDTLPAKWISDKTEWHVNPTGAFHVGGPDGDCGLTGRKIIVDTYGGAAPHGGGAFSGKDPTKVDRSAAYAARYLAKNVVAAGLAERCKIQIAYAIGVADPLSFLVDLEGTGHVDEAKLEAMLPQMMDLKPRGIRDHLDLNRAIYARTSAYGHFGREPESDGGFSWEKTDLVEALRGAF